MALFNNQISGLTPEYRTSPDVVNMDFFTDLSPLASLIQSSSKASATTQKKATNGKAPDHLSSQLYDYEAQKYALEQDREKQMSFMQAKLSNIMEKNPDMNINRAFAIMSPIIEADVNRFKQREIAIESLDALHKDNKKRYSQDANDKVLSSQYTMINDNFVGKTMSGEITRDENKIDIPLTNAEYFSMQHDIPGGVKYKQPTKIDPTQGDAWIDKKIAEASSHKTSNESKGFNILQQKIFTDKNGIVNSSSMTESNYSQLLAIGDYLKGSIPVEAQRAIKQNYLKARTDGEFIMKDGKPIRLRDQDFEKGFSMYLGYEVDRRLPGFKDYIHKTDSSISISSDGSSNGANGGYTDAMSYWGRIEQGDRGLFSDNVIFNAGGNENSIVGKAVRNIFDDLQNEIKSNPKLNTQELQDAYIKDPANIARLKNKYGININANTIKSYIENGFLDGVITKTKAVDNPQNANRGGYGGHPGARNVETKNNISKLNMPVSYNDFYMNLGMNILRAPMQTGQAYGSAGFGAIPKNTVYGEGMTIIPKAVSDNMILMETEEFYLNARRNDSYKKNRGDVLAKQSMLVTKEDLKLMKGEFMLNGKPQTLDYSNKNVQTLLNIQEKKYTSEEVKYARDEAEKNGNTKGSSKLKANETYYVVPVYQDFQQDAQSLKFTRTQSKDNLPPEQLGTGGRQFITNQQ